MNENFVAQKQDFWNRRIVLSSHTHALTEFLSSMASGDETTVTVTASVIGIRVDGSCEVRTRGAAEPAIEIPEPAKHAITGLRVSCQDPRFGTWFTIKATWRRENGLHVEVDDTVEPQWLHTPPRASDFVRDALRRPRPLHTMPEWLAERLA